MNSTILVSLLKHFSKGEIKLFSKFLDSPYYNSNKAAISLFDEIRKFYPEFNSELLKKKNVYKKVFPGEKFNDVKLRKLISDLNKLAEKFISVENLTRDSNQAHNAFLNFKKDRHYFDNAGTYLKNWKNVLDISSAGKDDNYYYFKFCYESHVSHISSFKPKVESSYKDKELKSLTCYFALKAMHIYCLNFIMSLAYGSSQENILLKEILALDDNGFFSEEPLIHIYCELIRLFTADIKSNRDLLYQIHKELAEKEKSIANDEKIALYWFISQYLVLTSGKFVLPWYNDLKWYYFKKQIELQIEIGEKFSWAAFVSIINNGLTQKEFDWINWFISGYTHLINYDNKKLLVSWAKAKVMYTKGEYVDSLKELLLINSNLGYMKYNISSLTIMNYYELGNYNELSYYLQSYGKYISKTDKLYDIGINKIIVVGFIKAVNLLVKLQYCSDPVQQDAIKFKIEKLTQEKILSRNWVLEKLNEYNIAN